VGVIVVPVAQIRGERVNQGTGNQVRESLMINRRREGSSELVCTDLKEGGRGEGGDAPTSSKTSG